MFLDRDITLSTFEQLMDESVMFFVFPKYHDSHITALNLDLEAIDVDRMQLLINAELSTVLTRLMEIDDLFPAIIS
jgi:hypothetical protein